MKLSLWAVAGMLSVFILSFSLCVLSILMLWRVVETALISIQVRRQAPPLSVHRLLYSQCADLTARLMQFQKLRHDMKNYVNTINLLLQRGYGQEAANCAQYVNVQLEQLSEIYCCAHPIANTVLSHKTAAAREQGVRVSISMQLDQNCGYADVDLISLFSNLLDNAMTACQQIEKEKRFITIHGRQRAGCFFVTVRNSKLHAPVSFHNGSPVTTKQNSHGLGTQILRDIAKRYQGTVRFLDESESFTTIVMLRNQEAETGAQITLKR